MSCEPNALFTNSISDHPNFYRTGASQFRTVFKEKEIDRSEFCTSFFAFYFTQLRQSAFQTDRQTVILDLHFYLLLSCRILRPCPEQSRDLRAAAAAALAVSVTDALPRWSDRRC